MSKQIQHAIELKMPSYDKVDPHQSAWCECGNWRAEGTVESVMAAWHQHLESNGIRPAPRAQQDANGLTPLWRDLARVIADANRRLGVNAQESAARPTRGHPDHSE